MWGLQNGPILVFYISFLFQMEANLGMIMVFTLISESIEWLGSKFEYIREHREEIRRQKKEAEEEEERVS